MKKIYHYTDAFALKSILEDCKLRLSDIRFLNDSNEYEIGRAAIERIFKGKFVDLQEQESIQATKNLEDCFKNSELSYTFIGAFSQKEDLLSQWRGYCPKEGGYALEFRFENLYDFGVPMQECIYDLEEQRTNAISLFGEVVESLKDNWQSRHDRKAAIRTLKLIWSNISRYKDPGFSEEDEIRFVQFKDVGDEEILFRIKNGILVPYTEIPLEDLPLRYELIVGLKDTFFATAQKISPDKNGRFDIDMAGDFSRAMRIVYPTGNLGKSNFNRWCESSKCISVEEKKTLGKIWTASELRGIPIINLATVWIGPCKNPKLAEDGVHRIIEHLKTIKTHPLASLPEGLPEVKSSKIPYRD